MPRLLLIALLCLPLAAGAAADEDRIYRTVDGDGNVVFTDQPPSDDAEPLDLGPITTVPAVETGNGIEGGRNEEQAPAHPGYAGLEIVYPTADQAIRHNGGQVPFRLKLQPAGVELAAGDRVEIMLDGQVRGSAAALGVTVGPIDRGPHNVSARVVDADRNVLATSQTVNFFLLRHSVSQP